jgi:hypothetical protein
MGGKKEYPESMFTAYPLGDEGDFLNHLGVMGLRKEQTLYSPFPEIPTVKCTCFRRREALPGGIMPIDLVVYKGYAVVYSDHPKNPFHGIMQDYLLSKKRSG